MLRKRQSISLLNKDTVWPFVGTVIYGILVLKQPDMGTAAIIVALMVGLYILAGLRLREVVGLLGILGAKIGEKQVAARNIELFALS